MIPQKKLSSHKPAAVFGNSFSRLLTLALIMTVAYACAPTEAVQYQEEPGIEPQPIQQAEPPSPDPRVGLEAGLFDAEEALWNLNKLSTTQPPEDFLGVTNSDLAFTGKYAIQGNYNGFLVWDISDPANPELVTQFLCPASQSDVSVYGDLLFVSGEGLGGRLDCGTEGVDERVSDVRLRGIRIFDISDIENPEYISNVQTCRGSHTHSLLTPADPESIYIYVSGSAPVRPEEELAGCSDALPSEDSGSALFRIEIIEVPLDNPEAAKIVSSPRIFENLTAPPEHGLAPAEIEELEEARAEGAYIVEIEGVPRVLPPRLISRMLNDIVMERGGEGDPTAADSSALRNEIQGMIDQMLAARGGAQVDRGPTQCHDITLYPGMDIAGGACEGYGLLLDISEPANPVRIDAVADSNFAYWHSATFANEGNKVIFTDEWGGGGGAKCRASDPMEWGANAIFTINEDNEMVFESYYKMPAPQTAMENCVAHNGSLIPVPGRDIMVQAWYQGGISIFDFTDPENPVEIAFHDRGPIDSTRMQMGGSWSVYWYNGNIVSSEIARGLDIFKLEPSPYLTKNEIAAARTISYEIFNAQDQPYYEFPPTFALARAYVDQLDRNDDISEENLDEIRQQLAIAESTSGSERAEMLSNLADEVESQVANATNQEKVNKLTETIRALSSS